MKSALPVLALILVGLLVFTLWPDRGNAEVGAVASETVERNREGPAEIVPVESEAADGSAERTKAGSGETRERVEHQLPAAVLAVLKGRCVDSDEAAIAGVAVRVHGWGANSERMDRHRKDHGRVEWTDPEPMVTGPDGRFEVAFVPPPPYQFTIALKRDDLLWMSGRWSRIPPGTVKDFGDVKMLGGCRVRGRLEDTKSNLIAKARISIDQLDRVSRADRGEIYRRDYLSCAVAADGSFGFEDLVPPGEYRLRVGREEVVSPKKFVVPKNQPDWFAMIVVKSQADVRTIEGIVVDEDGKPIPHADIEPQRLLGGRRYLDRSQRDGTFKLREEKRSTGAPVSFLFRRDGFENVETEKPIEWGSKNVRVVMKRGLGVQIRVTDGDEGKPVEDYSVIALPAPGHWRRSSSSDRRPRDRGHHEGGITVIRGLRRGPYLFLVDPDSKVLLHSRFHELVVGDRESNRLDVVLHRGVSRRVRVETTQGTPVVGTRLELLHQVGSNKVSFRTWAMKLYSGSHSSSRDFALYRADGETDRKGEVVFTAPPGSDYVVRAHGPGHRPHAEAGVVFAAAAGTLVIRVPVGARVFGKVRPAELVKQLLEEGKSSVQNGKFRVGFRLKRRNSVGRHEAFPTDDAVRFALGEDGSFDMTGIPPGTWKMRLHWQLNERELIDVVRDLKDGESRELNLDLARMVLSKVHGRVTLNGKPATGSVLTLHTNGAENARWRNYRLDAESRYRATVVPDTYQLTLQLNVGARRRVMLPADRALLVSPGQEIERDIAFHSGELRVTVVGADGKPRQGVQVHARIPGGEWGTTLPLTDAGGKAKTATKTAVLHLYVWPRHLMDPVKRRAFHTKHRGDPGAWKRQRIKVGEADVPAGGHTEIRVLLPESAGY